MEFKKISALSLAFITTILFFISLKTLSTFFRPFTIALIISMLLIPIVRFGKRFKIPDIVSIFIAVIAFIAVIWFVGIGISSDISKVTNALPLFKQNIASMLSLLDKSINYDLSLNKILHPDKMTTVIGNILASIGSMLSEIILIIVFIIFILSSYNNFSRNIKRAFGRSKFSRIAHAYKEIEDSIQQYLYVKTIISIGTALLSSVILYFFGIRYIILLGSIIFFFNYVPNIGSIFSVIIASLLYLLQFGWSINFIWLLILLSLVQFLFGNLLEPKFAGITLKLSPIVIIFSLFLWYWIWGIGGMIISIPLTSIIKIILEHSESGKKIALLME